MKSFVLSAAIAGCLIGGAAAAQGVGREGSEQYIPTKLQWVCVELNSLTNRDFLTDRYSISYHPDHSKNTITIRVTYMGDVDRSSMNTAIDAARELVKFKAKAYGWLWLEAREELIRIP